MPDDTVFRAKEPAAEGLVALAVRSRLPKAWLLSP